MLSKALFRCIRPITKVSSADNYKQLSKGLANSGYVLNFSAGWCGPCKMMAPLLEKKEKEANGTYKILKVDVDEPDNAELNEQFQVSGIPLFVFFKNGKEVDRAVGGMSAEKFDEFVKKIQ